MAGLSPQVRKIIVGVREIREENIYPLSLADQIAIPDKLIEAFSKIGSLDYSNITKSVTNDLLNRKDNQSEVDKEKDAETLKVAFDLIKDNIDYILEKSTDGVTTSDITNDQFVDIVDIVFTINYEGAVGKAVDLANRVMSLFKKKETQETQEPGPTE